MILFQEGISKNIKTCLEDGFDIDYYTLWNLIHVVNTHLIVILQDECEIHHSTVLV
jgi:hypothetical protein